MTVAPTKPATVRTTLAVALQLGRVYLRLVLLVGAAAIGDRSEVRRLAVSIASAILRGARGRALGRFVPSAIDQQRRYEPLTRPRPSRIGRGPHATAARKRSRRARVGA